MQLLVPKGHEDIVVAACGDGRMHGIREGQIVWSLDVARGREVIGNNQVRPPFSAGLVNAGVLIDSPKDQQLQLVDPATGIVKSYIPCRGAWSARGDYAAVVALDAVHVFEPGE
jgi:hypothetical protein